MIHEKFDKLINTSYIATSYMNIHHMYTIIFKLYSFTWQVVHELRVYLGDTLQDLFLPGFAGSNFVAFMSPYAVGVYRAPLQGFPIFKVCKELINVAHMN